MPLSVSISAPEESNVVCAINRLCDFAGLDTMKRIIVGIAIEE